MSDDEGAASDGDDEDSDYEDEFAAEIDDQEVEAEDDVAVGQEVIASEPREKVEKQIELLKAFYSPSKGKEKVGHAGASGAADANNNEISSSDSDYLLGDSCTSEEDEEAKEIQKNFMQFKKKLRSGQAAQLDDVFVEGPDTQTGDCTVIEDEGHATPYANSSDEDESSEETDLDGTSMAKQYPRFSKKDAVPKFSLGMKFRG
ncbi:unnamed protein product, partial [Urochloa humidicola]